MDGAIASADAIAAHRHSGTEPAEMTTETRTIRSTSARSATTDDIVLREGPMVRLVFRPLIVRNDQEPEAGLKGTFVYQRKGKAQHWEDVPPESLQLKTGEQYRLELHSAELLTLFRELSSLYDLHRLEGVPRGETRYVKAKGTVVALAQLTDEELKSVIENAESLGAPAIARLIRWASSAENFTLLFKRLELLEPNSLRNLNAALGVALLRRASLSWRQNKGNPDEEFWQNLLESQPFVFEQVFSLPIVVIHGKAYVGGKTVSNTGGHVADFIFKNAVTNVVGLIEIKTPSTRLLGAEYRSGVYNLSTELVGAIQQVIAYRQSLIEEGKNLLRDDPLLDSFSPRCMIVIGNAKNELNDNHKKQAFELFRQQLNGIEILTYDEMYERTMRLVSILEVGVSPDKDK